MALFGVTSCRELDAIFIQPEHLGFDEINAVLLPVDLALRWITLNLHSVWQLYRYIDCRKNYFSVERSS